MATATVWNSSDKGANITLSTTVETNDTASCSTSLNTVRGTTSHNSGKFYFEIKCKTAADHMWIGIADSTTAILSTFLSGSANSAGMRFSTVAGDIAVAGTGWTVGFSTSPGYTTNDVLQVAIDFGAGKCWFGKNNVYVNSGSPSAGTNATITFPASSTLFPAMSGQTSNDTGILRTIAADFSFTPPTGFSPWIIANTLSAAAGSYSITGQAATLIVGHIFPIVASAGSYALTGAAATMKKVMHISAAAGAYALTGAAAVIGKSLKFAMAAGSYALTGTAANLKKVMHLTLSAGSYSLTFPLAIIDYFPGAANAIRQAKFVLQKLRGSAPTLDQ